MHESSKWVTREWRQALGPCAHDKSCQVGGALIGAEVRSAACIPFADPSRPHPHLAPAITAAGRECSAERLLRVPIAGSSRLGSPTDQPRS